MKLNRSEFSRCQHRSPIGRRCKQPACPSNPSFCFTHAPKPEPPASALATELAQAARSLNSPQDVRRGLAKIFLALAEDRITTRKAAVLCYLAQTLLHTHREIAYRKKLRDEQEVRERPLILDMPRPIRDDEPSTPRPPAASASPSSPASSTGQNAPTPEHPPATVAQSDLPASEASHNKTSPPPAHTQRAQPAPPKPPDFYHHFYPWDPTLPPGAQDPMCNIPPESRPGSHNSRSRARPALRRYGGFNP